MASSTDLVAPTGGGGAVTNAGTFVVQENGAALTSLQLIDDALFTDDTSTHATGTTKGVGIMAVATPTDSAVDANDIGMVAMTVARQLKVDASGVAVPVTDNSGSLTVDAPLATPVFVTVTPSTTGGWSTFMASAADGSTALVATAQAVKASAGLLGGWYISNPNTSSAFVEIWDVASGSVTVGTTNPKILLEIPASSAANVEFTNGINFGTAITIAATTTAGGNTAPSTGLNANFFYK